MKKTFLLGTKPSLFVFLSVLFIANGVNSYFSPERSTVEFWLMIANFTVGLYSLFFMLIVLTDIFGTAPKVVVDSEGILLKSKAISSGRIIKWEEVQTITFHSLQIDFKLETEPFFFTYKSTATTSKKIKEAIRDMADMKGISVSGG